MEKIQYDKNGIKILPPQKFKKKPQHFGCWKVCYTTKEEAEYKASTSHDLRGDYHAYECKYSNPTHWHIGHKPRFEEDNVVPKTA